MSNKNWVHIVVAEQDAQRRGANVGAVARKANVTSTVVVSIVQTKKN